MRHGQTLYRTCNGVGEMFICILGDFFSKVVEMFKMKNTDIARNLLMHLSVSFILFSKGLPLKFRVN